MGALYSRRAQRGQAAPSLIAETAYAPGHVQHVLEQCGLEVRQSKEDLVGFCPFHSNNYTPSFSCSMETGLWLCFNPSCGERGTLQDLATRLSGLRGDSLSLLLQQQEFPEIPDLERSTEERFEYPEAEVQRHLQALPGSAAARYLRSRGFETELCQQYGLGYDSFRKAVSMAVRYADGTAAGEVFRKLGDKEYKNSAGLRKSETLWNIDQAKRKPEVYVCEGTLDALACIRAGLNAVALLGGGGSGISAEQAWLLNNYFTTAYIFTDNDPAGKKFGVGVAESFVRDVLFVPYGDVPHSDPGAMSNEEILQCAGNALTEFEVLCG